MDIDLQVDGLKQLRSALKQIDPELLKELTANLKAVAEFIAEDAKRRVPQDSGAARGSIRATSGGNKVYVRGGKAKVPYYGWLDFGSRTPISNRERSVGPWKSSGAGPKRGRFIYAAFDDNFDHVVTAVAEAVGDSIEQAGF